MIRVMVASYSGFNDFMIHSIRYLIWMKLNKLKRQL